MGVSHRQESALDVFLAGIVLYGRSVKKIQQPNKQHPNKVITTRSVVAMLGEIGFVVAIPLVFFVFVGHSLDTRLGTKVTFLFLGITIALASSAYTLYTMYKEIQQ